MSNRIKKPLSGYTLVSVDEDYHGTVLLFDIKNDILDGPTSIPSLSFEGDSVTREELNARRLHGIEKNSPIVDFIRNDRSPRTKLEPDNFVEVTRLNENTVTVKLLKMRGDASQYGGDTTFEYRII